MYNDIDRITHGQGSSGTWNQDTFFSKIWLPLYVFLVKQDTDKFPKRIARKRTDDIETYDNTATQVKSH